ncbi:MAG: hypothetical protein Q4D96_01935 [Propionibacteriaceae bacterium]|nr:hypothetical protein [Propionibacteriaceae bacterium]
MAPDVTEIPLNTPLGRLGAHTLIAFEDRCGVLRRDGRRFALHLLGDNKAVAVSGKPERRGVGDVVMVAAQLQPLRAFRLPEGNLVRAWLRPRDYLRHQLSGLVVLLVTGLFCAAMFTSREILVITGGLGILLSFPLAGMFLVGLGMVFQRCGWVFVIDDQWWALADLAVGPDPVEVATRQVDEVKEEYGRLLSDLPYRIQYPALFDAGHPATEELTLALFQWDSEQARLDRAEREALASRVTRAFHTARRHAERVKLGHLPEASRVEAGRALKAARIAVDPAASRTERAAALEAAVQILEGLALYQLPSIAEARDAVEGRRLKQLPGRRSA